MASSSAKVQHHTLESHEAKVLCTIFCTVFMYYTLCYLLYCVQNESDTVGGFAKAALRSTMLRDSSIHISSAEDMAAAMRRGLAAAVGGSAKYEFIKVVVFTSRLSCLTCTVSAMCEDCSAAAPKVSQPGGDQEAQHLNVYLIYLLFILKLPENLQVYSFIVFLSAASLVPLQPTWPALLTCLASRTPPYLLFSQLNWIYLYFYSFIHYKQHNSSMGARHLEFDDRELYF